LATLRTESRGSIPDLGERASVGSMVVTIC
jgi:hypothetical protein